MTSGYGFAAAQGRPCDSGRGAGPPRLLRAGRPAAERPAVPYLRPAKPRMADADAPLADLGEGAFRCHLVNSGAQQAARARRCGEGAAAQVPRTPTNYGAVRGPPLPRRRRRLRLSPPPATSGAPGESVGKALPVADVISGLTKAARRPPRGLGVGFAQLLHERGFK